MQSCCGEKCEKSETVCPGCGGKGMPVGVATVSHMVAEASGEDVGNGNYRFCGAPDCPIVYYDNERRITFRKNDLVVKVSGKEHGPAIPLCYCFNVTEGDIRSEVLATGRSTASQRIRKEVKAGRCACEVKNPSGRCCLRNIEQTEKWLMQGTRMQNVPKNP